MKKQKDFLELKDQIDILTKNAMNKNSLKDDTIEKLQHDLEEAIITKQDLQKELAVYKKKMELMKTKKQIMKNSGVIF